MALQGSGQMKMSDIYDEFTGTHNGSQEIQMSDYRDKGDVPAGSGTEIQLATDMYGASNISYTSATGGTITTYTSSGVNYKVHSFTSSGTFSDGDATPSVGTGNLWKHHASDQTITMFDDGIAGQIITVISTAAITYDVTSTNLKGGSTDIVTANGDVTLWCFDGTNWYLLQFMDVSADMSTIGGGGGATLDLDLILHTQVCGR